MSFSRYARSQIARRFAHTAIFKVVPAFAQSDRVLSRDESLPLAIARSGRVTGGRMPSPFSYPL